MSDGLDQHEADLIVDDTDEALCEDCVRWRTAGEPEDGSQP